MVDANRLPVAVVARRKKSRVLKIIPATKEENYLSSSLKKSTIAISNAIAFVTISTDEPCKDCQKVRIATPNFNQFKKDFLIIIL